MDQMEGSAFAMVVKKMRCPSDTFSSIRRVTNSRIGLFLSEPSNRHLRAPFAAPFYIRFETDSGHSREDTKRPLCAISGR